MPPNAADGTWASAASSLSAPVRLFAATSDDPSFRRRLWRRAGTISWMRRASLVVVAFVLFGAAGFALAGCSGSESRVGTATSTKGATQAQSADLPSPRIAKFKGPDFVKCRGRETHTLLFRYATKNHVQSVEAQVDGRPPTAHAIYDLRRGTIRFPYVCPGPHTFKITATGKDKGFVSAGVTFDSRNRADSATYGVRIESSG